MSERSVLLLIVFLALSSIIVVKTSAADPVLKPSIPEFALKYVDHSYYEQPTYSVDPYTGEQVKVNEGGYTKNDSIEVTIKNQPFTSYRDASGNYTTLYYNIRFKGHYADQWQTYPMLPADGYWAASQSDYTVVSLPNTQVGHFPAGQMDFQVQVLIGYEDQTTAWIIPGQGATTVYHFHGTEGSWSDTQTITIGPSTSTTTPNAPSSQNSTTPTPIQPEPENAVFFVLSWDETAIIVLLSIIAVLLVVLIAFSRKRSAK